MEAICGEVVADVMYTVTANQQHHLARMACQLAHLAHLAHLA